MKGWLSAKEIRNTVAPARDKNERKISFEFFLNSSMDVVIKEFEVIRILKY